MSPVIAAGRSAQQPAKIRLDELAAPAREREERSLEKVLRELPGLVETFGCAPPGGDADFGKLARCVLEAHSRSGSSPIAPGACRTYKRKKAVPAETAEATKARLDIPFSFAAHERGQFAVWLGLGLGQGTYKGTKLVAALSRSDGGWTVELKAKSTFKAKSAQTQELIDRNRASAEAFQGVPHVAQTEAFYTRESKDGRQRYGSIGRLYAKKNLRDVLDDARAQDLVLGCEDIFRLSHGILSGLEQIHARGRAHLDLSARNILLERTGPGHPRQAVVSDMDFCMTFQEAARPQTKIGTRLYSLPRKAPSGEEFIFGPEDDVFGAGSLIYELCFGVAPKDYAPPVYAWEPRSSRDVLERRRHALDRKEPLEALLFTMLDPVASSRPTAQAARQIVEALRALEAFDHFCGPGASGAGTTPPSGSSNDASSMRPSDSTSSAAPPFDPVAEPVQAPPLVRPPVQAPPLVRPPVQPLPRPPPSEPISIRRAPERAMRSELRWGQGRRAREPAHRFLLGSVLSSE